MVATTVFASTAPVALAPETLDSIGLLAVLLEENGVEKRIVAEAPLRPEVSAAVRHRIPAGWYPDRENPARRRWWDGTTWTEHYTPLTAEVTVPRAPRHLAAVTEPVEVSAQRAPVPVLVIVLLAALGAANAVLLTMLASGR
jgi:hypothetical protein